MTVPIVPNVRAGAILFVAGFVLVRTRIMLAAQR